MLDKIRLAKVLALTTSDNDSEALAAIRRANEIIKGEGLQWSDLITATVNTINITMQRHAPAAGTVDGDDRDWQPPHLREATIINPMFQAIYSQPRTGSEGFWLWLDDVHAQWLANGRLTAGQYNAVRRCYNRTRRHA